jgi:UDP-glucose 4-epimerase
MIKNAVFIVTGGSGFIGSNLLDFLSNVQLGLGEMKIISIDKRTPDLKLKNVEYMTIDLNSPGFRYYGEKPTAVFHLAGSPWAKVKGDQGWLAETDDCFYNNTTATYNVLSKIRPNKIIFSSTANLYGEGRKLKEDDPKKISSPYGYSKWVAEEAIRKSGIEYVIYRFGTVVGIRGRTFPNRLVYCAVHGIPIDLFYKGNAYRDLIAVEDICRALTSAIFFPLNSELKKGDNTYNVSMGMEMSGSMIACIVAEKAKEYGYKLNYSLVDSAPNGYVKESTLNIEKLYMATGWKPKTKLSNLIDDLFKYYEEPDAKEPPVWESL